MLEILRNIPPHLWIGVPSLILAGVFLSKNETRITAWVNSLIEKQRKAHSRSLTRQLRRKFEAKPKLRQ